MSEFDHQAFLQTLTAQPGVYRMLGAEQVVLYVGKAKNLKRRVASYFRASVSNNRIRSMVSQIQGIEITVTHTEAEALLLEHNLIKQHRPRYNVLLRDDKSYPSIFVSTKQTYPRMAFHRGSKRLQGRYFGPYPSSYAVRETMGHLQKIFKIRQCEDSVFKNRSRPCLQYQIQRCSGPCVDLVAPQAYAQSIQYAVDFLEGRSSKVINELVTQMEAAAQALDYEKAAGFRDQIEALRQVSAQQGIDGQQQDVDIIACEMDAGQACVQVFTIRDGRNLGNRAYYPSLPGQLKAGKVLHAFLGQYYLQHLPPNEILLNQRPDDLATLTEMLRLRRQANVQIKVQVRGQRARWLDLAKQNAQTALQTRLQSRGTLSKRLLALQDWLGMETMPNRLECYDISHTQGEATIASCVVFDANGPLKSDYRRFNIEGIEAGDDYAAMDQVLTRRFSRLKAGEGKMPDVVLIDGGKGQLQRAYDSLQTLGIPALALLSIKKGEGRLAKFDQVLSLEHDSISVQSHADAVHILQQLRDEAHRFAISGHRQKRAKARNTSILETIPGLGPKRRQQLIKQFGGVRGVSNAGVEELSKVPGISKRLAQAIYDEFHAPSEAS